MNISKQFFLGILTLTLAACSQFQNDKTLEPNPNENTIQTPEVKQPTLKQNLENHKPTAPAAIRADLEYFGSAPELENDVWLNTDGPLRLENLRGQVVLLEMWTFG